MSLHCRRRHPLPPQPSPWLLVRPAAAPGAPPEAPAHTASPARLRRVSVPSYTMRAGGRPRAARAPALAPAPRLVPRGPPPPLHPRPGPGRALRSRYSDRGQWYLEPHPLPGDAGAGAGAGAPGLAWPMRARARARLVLPRCAARCSGRPARLAGLGRRRRAPRPGAPCVLRPLAGRGPRPGRAHAPRRLSLLEGLRFINLPGAAARPAARPQPTARRGQGRPPPGGGAIYNLPGAPRPRSFGPARLASHCTCAALPPGAARGRRRRFSIPFLHDALRVVHRPRPRAPPPVWPLPAPRRRLWRGAPPFARRVRAPTHPRAPAHPRPSRARGRGRGRAAA
ncbi:MAG: hypothetical protein J3K34DRAFT_27404 [Monoraphidium minutum]|nr:MAG: hypothetical protein J3K34DRAFT_27404 [Monoraphidium minutum]